VRGESRAKLREKMIAHMAHSQQNNKNALVHASARARGQISFVSKAHQNPPRQNSYVLQNHSSLERVLKKCRTHLRGTPNKEIWIRNKSVAAPLA
jgi:hypothetical protein